MDNVIAHYFHLRRCGLKPCDAWDYAVALDAMDQLHFNH